MRAFAVGGGAAFVLSLLYAGASFLWSFGVDAGPWSFRAGWLPAFINFELFTTFATHHSVFARTGLKAWVARKASPPLERSIYVWVASALLVLTCVFWQPVPGRLWDVTGWARVFLFGLQLAGVVLTIVSARQLDALSLAGIRQVLSPHPADDRIRLVDTGVFSLVRHPLYLAWFLMVVPTPEMTGTRLAFAVTSCLYLVLAIPFEERDLRRTLGPEYEAYARRVRWRLFPLVY